MKSKAIRLRRKGTSLREVERILKMPKSTLSGWFRGIQLTEEQLTKLKNKHTEHLVEVRKKAVKWHNLQKENRLKEAAKQANNVLSLINTNDIPIIELTLAMLYLGEGSKTKSGTSMGSSDPLILKFFINLLLKIYSVEISRIKCSLHLRADQDPKKLRRYWAKELNISLDNFTSTSIDLRTKGKSTYPNYNGVCVINCGNIAIQRRLVYLSRKFCERIIKKS